MLIWLNLVFLKNREKKETYEWGRVTDKAFKDGKNLIL